jgi:hypothetical protein
VKVLALAVFVAAVTACRKDHAITSVTTPPDTLVTTTAVVFPGGTVTAAVAATCAERTAGLMHVDSLGADRGMLFVFEENHDSTDVAFWMEDTSLALSIAFIDANGRVVNVDNMAPETLTYHYASGPFRYALEVNQGWFATHGIGAGTIATFTLPAGTITDPYPCA